jgi:hypothetical protein
MRTKAMQTARTQQVDVTRAITRACLANVPHTHAHTHTLPAIFKIHRHHADALALVHDQIQRKVLDEKFAVVFQCLTVESVQH